MMDADIIITDNWDADLESRDYKQFSFFDYDDVHLCSLRILKEQAFINILIHRLNEFVDRYKKVYIMHEHLNQNELKAILYHFGSIKICYQEIQEDYPYEEINEDQEINEGEFHKFCKDKGFQNVSLEPKTTLEFYRIWTLFNMMKNLKKDVSLWKPFIDYYLNELNEIFQKCYIKPVPMECCLVKKNVWMAGTSTLVEFGKSKRDAKNKLAISYLSWNYLPLLLNKLTKFRFNPKKIKLEDNTFLVHITYSYDNHGLKNFKKAIILSKIQKIYFVNKESLISFFENHPTSTFIGFSDDLPFAYCKTYYDVQDCLTRDEPILLKKASLEFLVGYHLQKKLKEDHFMLRLYAIISLWNFYNSGDYHNYDIMKEVSK